MKLFNKFKNTEQITAERHVPESKMAPTSIAATI